MDTNNILPEDLPIWQIYNGKCVLCKQPAVTLHEEPPKSLNPLWKQMPETRFALCNECHMWMHEIPRANALELLTTSRTSAQRDALLELRAQEQAA